MTGSTIQAGKRASYPAYKPSGDPWLGDIPEHWEVRRLKYTADLINQKVDGAEGGLPYMGLDQIESWTGKRLGQNGDASSDGQANLFQRGDVLLGKLRPYLAKAYAADSEGICTGEFLVLRPNAVEQKFLLNYVLNPDFVAIVDSSTYGAKMPRANWDFIGNLPTLIPPRNEQKDIAAFLDRESARIDKLIEKKRRQIELLKEKRSAVISHAVTKGLDPNVPMKDSGIEWLGKVPEHWKVKRLRFLAKINPVKSEVLHLLPDTEVSFVSMEAVREYGGMSLNRTKRIEEVYQGYTYFRDGDVVIAKITPCFENGKGSIAANLTNDVGFGTTELHVVRLHPKIDRQFFFYISVSIAFRQSGEAEMYGAGGQKRVPDSFIRDYRFPVPPLEERQRIIRFLDAETGRLDKMTEKINVSIDKLLELRTALISAAVTGKIDVRDAAPS